MKWVLVALLLAAVVWWMFQSDLERGSLGAGVQLGARASSSSFLVQGADGCWRLFPADAREVGDGLPLPAGIAGTPRLDSQGRVLLLDDESLRRASWAPEGLQIETLALPAPAEELELIGVDGADEPVLARHGDERDEDGAPPELLVRFDGSFTALATADGQRPLPAQAVVVATMRRALACRGAEGWEVWIYSDPQSPVRRVTPGCRGPVAVFTPDGSALVTDGKTDGLWQIDLDRDSQGHMAAGNLGSSPRVPWSCGFRGDPALLMAPQWDIQGYLQLFQTNLSGGGRWGFTTGFTQHYLPAVSADGRHLGYVQAAFDPAGEQPFEEELFLFDFDHPRRSAVSLGKRAGGQPGIGPVFVGTGSTLVWIAEGRVHRVSRPESRDPQE